MVDQMLGTPLLVRLQQVMIRKQLAASSLADRYEVARGFSETVQLMYHAENQGRSVFGYSEASAAYLEPLVTPLLVTLTTRQDALLKGSELADEDIVRFFQVYRELLGEYPGVEVMVQELYEQVVLRMTLERALVLVRSLREVGL